MAKHCQKPEAKEKKEMSLTRKALSAMGIEEAQIDQIIEMHTGVVNEIKEERDALKSDADRLPAVQKELDELKKEVAKQGEENPFKVKYDALKEEFDKYKKGVEEKETTAKKETVYSQILKEVGIPEKIMNGVIKASKSKIDAMELDDEGKAKNSEELVKGIKEEWADFIVTEHTKGANTATPPKTTDGKKYTNTDEIMAIKDKNERLEAIASHKELFQ